MKIYEEFINNILSTRGRFVCGDEYHERHHIIPRCVGGTNDEDNLIDLFAKEHFIAHKILALENPDNNSLVYAWTMMSWVKCDHHDRYELTPEEYEEAKKRFSAINKGKTLSEETRKKISEAKKNITEETRKKMSDNHADVSGKNNPMYGKNHSEETKQKLRELSKGQPSPMKCKKHSREAKEKMSASKKGKYTGEDNPNYGNHKLKGRFTGVNSPSYGSGKAVIQLTLNGEFVNEYVSAYEAGKMTGINRGGITQVCNHTNNRTIAGGFRWMFKSEYLELQLNCN